MFFNSVSKLIKKLIKPKDYNSKPFIIFVCFYRFFLKNTVLWSY